LRFAVLCVLRSASSISTSETAHGAHGAYALYEHWYRLTPLAVIGIETILGAADFHRHSNACVGPTRLPIRASGA